MATKQNIKGAITILTKAQALLSNGHWIQNDEHTTTASGKEQFCAMGAIKEVSKRNAEDTVWTAFEALADTLPTRFTSYGDKCEATSAVVSFNDFHAFRARQVTRKMGKAIQILRRALAA